MPDGCDRHSLDFWQHVVAGGLASRIVKFEMQFRGEIAAFVRARIGGDKMAHSRSLAAIAGVLSLGMNISVGHAGSVTQPGETVGVAAGAPLPQGVNFVNTFDDGHRDGVDVFAGVDIPVVAWSTPWTLFGARVQVLVAKPVIEAGVPHSSFNVGVNNPLLIVNWPGTSATDGRHLLGRHRYRRRYVSCIRLNLHQPAFRRELHGEWLEPDREPDLGHSYPRGERHDQPTFSTRPDRNQEIREMGARSVAFVATDLNSPNADYRKQTSSRSANSSVTTSTR